MSAPMHLGDLRKRPAFLALWEKQRHNPKFHWFMECFAEALGVFFYVYAGVGSTAAMILGTLLKEPALGSLLQVGFAYAFGILLAITVCGATSGGHFNPCVTISFVVFKGFPPLKALRYIAAQILGAYIACLIVYVQYRDIIVLVEEGLQAANTLDAIQFTPGGPGGILGLYVNPGTNLSRTLLNEFVTDVFLGLVIWACLDPTNSFVPPAAAPWVISFAYAAAIWGYAVNGLAANCARDLGGRLANMTIYGMKASGGAYAAIAALTNIPAMLFAALIYELFLTDSDRVIPAAQRAFLANHLAHRRNPARPAHEHEASDSSLYDDKDHPHL